MGRANKSAPFAIICVTLGGRSGAPSIVMNTPEGVTSNFKPPPDMPGGDFGSPSGMQASALAPGLNMHGIGRTVVT